MLKRGWAWWRRHQLLVDLAWISPLLLLSWLLMPAHTNYGGPAGSIRPAVYAALTLGLCLPLIWRRRWPRGVFAFVALVAFAQWLAGLPPVTPDLAVLPAMYTVAVKYAFGWAAAAGAVTALGGVLGALRLANGEWRAARSVLVSFIVAIGGVWILRAYTW